MVQLPATGIPMHTQSLMWDGARPHTANEVLDFLQETFSDRVHLTLFHSATSMDTPGHTTVRPLIPTTLPVGLLEKEPVQEEICHINGM
jgi:hypothetical protein